MRKRLFSIIEVAEENDRVSQIYDFIMMLVIVVSIVPLAFKKTNGIFTIIDEAAAIVFVADYALRWLTADLRLKKGVISFVLYPITFLAIIDLLAILPSFVAVNGGLRLFKIFRLTTVGYGDIYPTSDIGRFITMVSSLIGIAIVALPASIITAGYMEVVNENASKREEQNEEKND